jgi:hypothetical protein
MIESYMQHCRRHKYGWSAGELSHRWVSDNRCFNTSGIHSGRSLIRTCRNRLPYKMVKIRCRVDAFRTLHGVLWLNSAVVIKNLSVTNEKFN